MASNAYRVDRLYGGGSAASSKLVTVRPKETDPQSDDTVQGQPDSPLSPGGTSRSLVTFPPGGRNLPESGSGRMSVAQPPLDDVGFADDSPKVKARPCTEKERSQARMQANFFGATSGNRKPVALWILGPSAVGKSTISMQAALEFDIPRMEIDEGRWVPDAVVVDGEFFRVVHNGYQQWITTPQWRSAYPAIKKLINEEKSLMMEEAAMQGKHLLIPHTALKVDECLREMRRFAELGYINHVIGVVAPREEVARRGKQREREVGKRYAPEEFDKSMAAFRPLMSACNGRYEVVTAIPLVEGEGRRHMSYEVLSSGVGPTEDPSIPMLPI